MRAGEHQEQGRDRAAMAAEVPTEVEAPITPTPTPQNLPAPTIGIKIPPSILQGAESPSVLYGMRFSSESFVNVPAGAISSSTLSLSNFTSTDPGDEIDHTEQVTDRHDTFYFEDGNVEIVCGNTIFRIHSTIISFSSYKLREILSPPALLHAPTPEGHPRITLSESAEDFGILLKMIYTPGSVSSSIAVSSAN